MKGNTGNSNIANTGARKKPTPDTDVRKIEKAGDRKAADTGVRINVKTGVSKKLQKIKLSLSQELSGSHFLVSIQSGNYRNSICRQ